LAGLGLGFSNSADACRSLRTATVVYERGYGSEAAANASLEMILSLEAHCPTSARDWLPSASAATCRAEAHALAGFVMHRRPLAHVDHALTHFEAAVRERRSNSVAQHAVVPTFHVRTAAVPT
jgi:hypothetical protein